LKDYVADGTNEIAIVWPDDDSCDQSALAAAADALMSRLLPCFYRVFGEIHTLSVFNGDIATCANAKSDANRAQTARMNHVNAQQ
jgi:hypothetical protein